MVKNGISVMFSTMVHDGGEVIALRYRVNGVLGCKLFAETRDSRTNEVRSAVDNMVDFVYRLLECTVG